MMTIFKNSLVGASIALIALVSLALPTSFVNAADIGEVWGDYSGGGDVWADSGEVWGDYYGGSGEVWGDYNSDYSGEVWGDYYGGSGEVWGDYYSSGSSYGGSGFSLPSFGSANYNYRSSNSYPTFYTPPSKPGNSTVTTNTCVNNSCNYTDNSIVDNSVKVSNSFNNQKQKKEHYAYNDCYDYQYGYGQQGYNYGSYNYQGNCYTYAAPIAYNTTPYISLSQTPYTGLDLGPMGEVLYWTFLVLWCLGAAYLIVVKRVQTKIVGYLNSFLFGAATTTVVHTTHAPAHTYSAAAPAPVTEDGIDPFIASQIKR